MLYNIHRSILSKNSTWFRSLFDQETNGLPSGWELLHTPLGEKIFVNYKLRRVSFAQPQTVDEATGAFILRDVTSQEFDASSALSRVVYIAKE